MGGKQLSDGESQRISAVARAVELLRALAALPPESRTLTALAHKSGIKVPSAHHLLVTLVGEGVVTKDASRRYHFGPTLCALSEIAYRENRPPSSMRAGLQHLVDVTGENAYLSGWVHGEIRVLEELSGTHAVRVAVPHRGFEYARASGKMLLALLEERDLDAYLSGTPLESITPNTTTDPQLLRRQLSEIREQGFAIEKGECVDGVACCAAPVLNNGLVVAAMTVSSPMDRFLANEDKLVAAVLECASRASSTKDSQATSGNQSPIAR